MFDKNGVIETSSRFPFTSRRAVENVVGSAFRLDLYLSRIPILGDPVHFINGDLYKCFQYSELLSAVVGSCPILIKHPKRGEIRIAAFQRFQRFIRCRFLRQKYSNAVEVPAQGFRLPQKAFVVIGCKEKEQILTSARAQVVSADFYKSLAAPPMERHQVTLNGVQPQAVRMPLAPPSAPAYPNMQFGHLELWTSEPRAAKLFVLGAVYTDAATTHRRKSQ